MDDEEELVHQFATICPGDQEMIGAIGRVLRLAAGVTESLNVLLQVAFCNCLNLCNKLFI